MSNARTVIQEMNAALYVIDNNGVAFAWSTLGHCRSSGFDKVRQAVSATNCHYAFRLFYVVLLGVIPERPEAHAQQLRSLDLDAACAHEGLRDVLLLQTFHMLFQVEAGFGQQSRRGRAFRHAPRNVFRQALGQNRLALFKRDSALDYVLELADIAWPFVRIEQFHGLL